MSNSASNVRDLHASPQPGETESLHPEGSSSSARKIVKPLPDQPTIITSTAPLPSPATADSSHRILDGRVMPGDRLGHFELLEFVGGGGMGRVFRAHDTKLDRIVALKVLPPEQGSDSDASQRFQNEAQSAARLDHKNIARVFHLGEENGLSYIVFEFIEGVNVRLLVEQKGPLPLDEALSYTIQIAEALAHVDACSVVHRDIKPSNVLITPEGRAKLIDLGLARLKRTDPEGADLTASGVTLGTFDYISPEQARDPRCADIRSDIYSLGCTLFFMLAGQPPFPEGTVLQKLLQHQGDKPPDIRQFRPDMPEELSRLLQKMMAKDPGRHHANPTELVSDLCVLGEQIGLRPLGILDGVWTPTSEPEVSFFHRHLPWMVPVASLVCIVLLMNAFWPPAARDDVLPPLPSADAEEENEMVAEHAIAPAKPLKPSSDIFAAEKLPKPPPDIFTSAKSVKPSSDVFPAEKTGKLSSDFFSSEKPAKPYSDVYPLEKPVKSFSDVYPFEKPAKSLADAFPLEKPAKSLADAFPLEKPVKSLTDSFPQEKPAKSLTDSFPQEKPVKSLAEAFASDKSAETPSKRSGPLIVSETATGENEYYSLGAACSAANSGDVIELRYNGLRQERPIKISNLKLTIKPGDGYQPVVVFSPTEINPMKYSRSMFTLSAGQLTMSDVAVELHVPRDVPADNWSLFETWGGQTVQFERCSLTVHNASDQFATYHQEVAFVRARPAPDASTAVESVPAATPLATLKLTDCVVRGEAVFLLVEDLQPVNLLWDNGLLATTEQLLSSGGGQMVPKPDEMLQVDLRHLTADVRGGLCRLTNTPSNPFQLTVRFTCADNIFLTAPDVPLVEQEGATGGEKSRERFFWKGDRNFYPDVDTFWVARNADPSIPQQSMSFDAWKAHWGPSRENQPSRAQIPWKTSPHGYQALHAHTPADYTLLKNSASDDASAGAPGLHGDRLPPLPSDAYQERPARAGVLRGGSADRHINRG